VVFAAFFRVKVAVVIEEVSRFSLNVAVTAAPVGTPVWFFVGFVEVTVGGVVSVAAGVLLAVDRVKLSTQKV
jgi:hypothetical protein